MHHRWGLYGSDELQHLRHLQDHQFGEHCQADRFLGSCLLLGDTSLTCQNDHWHERGSCLHSKDIKNNIWRKEPLFLVSWLCFQYCFHIFSYSFSGVVCVQISIASMQNQQSVKPIRFSLFGLRECHCCGEDMIAISMRDLNKGNRSLYEKMHSKKWQHFQQK